jgi:hypothetical protein
VIAAHCDKGQLVGHDKAIHLPEFLQPYNYQERKEARAKKRKIETPMVSQKEMEPEPANGIQTRLFHTFGVAEHDSLRIIDLAGKLDFGRRDRYGHFIQYLSATPF